MYAKRSSSTLSTTGEMILVSRWKGRGFMNNHKGLLIASLLFFIASYIPDASAMHIITHVLDESAPSNAVGKGNLADIARAAARIWESAYYKAKPKSESDSSAVVKSETKPESEAETAAKSDTDQFTLELYFAWAPAGSAGLHAPLEWDSSNRETLGLILVNNSSSTAYYLDPTPYSNEEYEKRVEESQYFGASYYNASCVFSKPHGDAAKRVDLLSVILHEIGHALGMSAENPSFYAQIRDGVLQIGKDLLPLASNRYGVTPHFSAIDIRYGSLMSGINSDERRLPSGIDILANAQISGFITNKPELQ
jgi:hypothetical protein